MSLTAGLQRKDDNDKMIALIQDRRQELNELCKRYRVKRLELFGSAANDGSFDAGRSDLDFLVDFFPLARGEHADHYFGLREDLESLFGRRIDLVMVTAVKNPYFLQAIDACREALYAA